MPCKIWVPKWKIDCSFSIIWNWLSGLITVVFIIIHINGSKPCHPSIYRLYIGLRYPANRNDSWRLLWQISTSSPPAAFLLRSWHNTGCVYESDPLLTTLITLDPQKLESSSCHQSKIQPILHIIKSFKTKKNNQR